MRSFEVKIRYCKVVVEWAIHRWLTRDDTELSDPQLAFDKGRPSPNAVHDDRENQLASLISKDSEDADGGEDYRKPPTTINLEESRWNICQKYFLTYFYYYSPKKQGCLSLK